MVKTKLKLNLPSPNITPHFSRLGFIHSINETNEFRKFVFSALAKKKRAYVILNYGEECPFVSKGKPDLHNTFSLVTG